MADQAPDHFLSHVERKLRHFKGQPTEKVEILNQVTPLLERVKDQRLRILYLQEVADRLGVTPQWVEQQLRRNTTQISEKTEINRQQTDTNRIPTDESILVQFMLHKPEYLELVRSSGAVEKFVSDEARMTAQRIIEKYCQNPNDFDRLGASLISQGMSAHLLTGHIAGNTGSSNLDEAGEKQLVHDCLVRVRERDLKIRSKSILNSIKNDAGNNAEKLEIFLKISKEQKGPKTLPED
jgi:DNA primase